MTSRYTTHTHQGTQNTTQDHNADMQYIATQTPRLLFLAQAKLRTVQHSEAHSRRDTPTLHKSILLLNTIFSAEDAAEREREKEESWYNRMANHLGDDSDEEEEEEMREMEGWDDEQMTEQPDATVEVVEVEGSESDEDQDGYELSDDEDQHMEYSFSSVSSGRTSPTPLTYSVPSLVYTSTPPSHNQHIYSPTPTKAPASFYDDDTNFAFSSDPLDPFVSDDEDDDELVTPPQAMHDSFGDDEDDGDFGGMADEEREALEGLQLFSMRAC